MTTAKRKCTELVKSLCPDINRDSQTDTRLSGFDNKSGAGLLGQRTGPVCQPKWPSVPQAGACLPPGSSKSISVVVSIMQL